MSGVATALARWGAALRGDRLFHPRGVLFDGVLTVGRPQNRGVALLDSSGEHPVLVRLSKAAPLPGRMPDVLGLAVRVPDADGAGAVLDLALATTGRRPVLRHVLMPSGDFGTAFFSSLLPYQVGRQRGFLAAACVDSSRRLPAQLDGLAAAVADDPVEFAVLAAGAAGPWQPVASLTVTGPSSADDPSFDVIAHALDTLYPRGRLNRLRGPVYRGSQCGRSGSSRA